MAGLRENVPRTSHPRNPGGGCKPSYDLASKFQEAISIVRSLQTNLLSPTQIQGEESYVPALDIQFHKCEREACFGDSDLWRQFLKTRLADRV